MPFSELKKIIQKEYGPALLLRTVVSYETRQRIQRNLLIASFFLFFLSIFVFAIQKTEIVNFVGSSFLDTVASKLYAVFLMVFACTYVFSALEAMHRSYYFKGLNNILREQIDPAHTPVSWEVATIVAETNDKDITKGFIDSEYGQEILYRAGITEADFVAFCESRTPAVAADTFVVERDKGVVLETYARSIYKHDAQFAQFLANNAINTDQFTLAARWVTTIERMGRRNARWWSRDNLGRVPGIGKTWGYGETYLLERHGHDLVEDHIWASAVLSRHREDDEVEGMEQVLARARQSNVLVVGNDLMTIRKRVAQLYHKIRAGHILTSLEARRIFFIDIESLVTAYPTKAEFETGFQKLLEQAVGAGNIILYFEYLATDIASAKTLGVDIIDVMLPFFESDQIQIIAAATKDGYNNHLQRDTRITQEFDRIQMQDISSTALIEVLQQRALEIERNIGLVFSIPALGAIARLADQYFPTGAMPDKAFDLIEELAPMAASKGIHQLQQEDVETLVSEKTGVPIGTPSDEERDKLLSLEDFLHRRVVGQNRAVDAVAKALRRSRAGVGGHDRPMGSFLFLGPTGVGKTETAKALAEVLFGNEDAMIRLDMSEFQGSDALERLIGSYETGSAGRLATLIREKQYGVLLLDEFEKSDPNVHDLFLQVLDEGYFTDASGKKVNAQNLIIIATSNAGADLLWEWEKTKQDLSSMKRTLVDSIIDRGLFRPEFLNRFDDIIMFHVLSAVQIRAIAIIQLDAFRERLLKDKQVELAFSDDLVDAIAKIGYDPQFGGRPMRRAIKDKVEQAVADKMLKGEIQSGAHLTLSASDIQG